MNARDPVAIVSLPFRPLIEHDSIEVESWSIFEYTQVTHYREGDFCIHKLTKIRHRIH